MKLYKKLQAYILPKQLDFFALMKKQMQCSVTIIHVICDFYQNEEQKIPENLKHDMKKAKLLRKRILTDLSRTFITPVDKEAIGRVVFHLNELVLKVKHLLTEIEVYKIYSLKKCTPLFDIIWDESKLLEESLDLTIQKEYLKMHKNTDDLLHLSNAFSKSYANLLHEIFKGDDQRKIFEHKEILFQLKDINHTIINVNYALEDIVFKMN